MNDALCIKCCHFFPQGDWLWIMDQANHVNDWRNFMEDELVSTKTELGWDGYHATMLAHHQYLLVMGVHCSGYDLF